MTYPRQAHRSFTPARSPVAVLLLAAAVLALAGAGPALAEYDGYGDDAAPAAQSRTAPAPGRTVSVGMTDQLRFVEPEIRIKVGDTVEWRTVGRYAHTVTADPGKAANPANVSLPPGAAPFDSGLVRNGETFRIKFTKPGVYSYVCLPHEQYGMLGRIIVG